MAYKIAQCYLLAPDWGRYLCSVRLRLCDSDWVIRRMLQKCSMRSMSLSAT